MSEWWTYSLSDFQMYSGATYLRLLEAYNAWLYPAQALALAFGCWLIWAAWRGNASALRLALAGLGACWLWIAGAFFWTRLAPIDLAAPWFAYGFAAQGALLLAFAARMDAERVAPRPIERILAMSVVDFAVIALPLVMWLGVDQGDGGGSRWAQAALFALTPDATALATLGFVLALRGARWLMVLPLAWCLVSGALQWNLGFAVALVVPATALAAVALAVVSARAPATRPRDRG